MTRPPVTPAQLDAALTGRDPYTVDPRSFASAFGVTEAIAFAAIQRAKLRPIRERGA